MYVSKAKLERSGGTDFILSKAEENKPTQWLDMSTIVAK
jgi:hypothetical protein